MLEGNKYNCYNVPDGGDFLIYERFFFYELVIVSVNGKKLQYKIYNINEHQLQVLHVEVMLVMLPFESFPVVCIFLLFPTLAPFVSICKISNLTEI